MTKVKCKACNKEYTLKGLTRHIKTCKEIDKGYGSSESTGYFKIRIQGGYSNEYFIYIDIKVTSTLGELDRFLRETWVECCNHLSGFIVGDEFIPMEDEERNIKLKDILEEGLHFGYEYDFGSTTYLKLNVLSENRGSNRNDTIRILARNNDFEYKCIKCGKEADGIRDDRDSEPYCNDCSYKGEYLLPIVNSPRMGVCSYGDDDGVIWSKTLKNKSTNEYREYEDLINKIKSFEELKLWNDINEKKIFGIRKDEDIFYCKIVGDLDKAYGLEVYKNQKGLESLVENNYETKYSRLDTMYLKFVKDIYLSDFEIKLMNSYDLSDFDGLGYLSLRNKDRNYVDGELNEIQIKEFEFVLDGIIEFCKNYKENKLNEFDKDIRVIYKENKVWKEKIESVDLKYRVVKVDESKLKKLKKNKKTNNIWELSVGDSNYTEVEEDTGKLFYLRNINIIDLDEYVIGRTSYTIDDDLLDELIEDLITSIKSEKIIPKEIHVNEIFVLEGIKEFCNALDIKVKMVSEFKNEDIFSFMLEVEDDLEEMIDDLMFRYHFGIIDKDELEKALSYLGVELEE